MMGFAIDNHEHSPRPRVAGVVVNYNYERYLRESVNSLLNQTDAFDELFVVDDGSTDGSLELLKEYEGRVRIIVKENGGPLSAAFAAVASTDCDYFYLLDADDIAEPDLVAAIHPYLEAKPVKVQFQLRSIDVVGEPIDSVFPNYKDDYSSRQMVVDNERLGFYVCAPTSGNVFRTEYLDFLRTQRLNEREAYDGVPAQLAPYFGDVLSINRPLARYRVHETSLSAWSKPTPALMQRELARYANRWEDGLRVLANQNKEAPDPTRSAYVLERELMIPVLLGRRPRMQKVIAYAFATLRSGRTLPQRVAFSAWGAALLVLPRRRAFDLAVSKRAVSSRGPFSMAIARVSRARSRVRASRPG